MQKSKEKKLLGAVLMLALLAGCVETALIGMGAGAALGGYKWWEGNLTRDYPRPLPEMWQASLNVLQHFKMKVTEKKYSPLTAVISAVQADGTEVKVSLDAQPNRITTVGIRFGIMGNREASEMFHNQLAREVGL